MHRLTHILLILTMILLIGSVPVSASVPQGSYATEFREAVKKKKIKLKKYDCKGTTLYADTGLPKKRVRQVRKWILELPKSVRKTAKRVYFVRKKFYLLTGDKSLRKAYGYAAFPPREIWFYNIKDTDELIDTVYHEFGHCFDWDSKKQKFTRSSTKKWKKIVDGWVGISNSSLEFYAETFAELFTEFHEPEFRYIVKELGIL